MSRPPIGEQAMTDVERQRKRRARLQREAWDPVQEALDIKIKLEEMGLDDDAYKTLIAEMCREVEEMDFKVVLLPYGEDFEGWEYTVTVSVTERMVTPMPLAKEIAQRIGLILKRPFDWNLDDVLAARDESFDLSASPPTWLQHGKKKIELDEDTAKLVRKMLKMRKQVA